MFRYVPIRHGWLALTSQFYGRFNSTPKLFACKPCTLLERLELGPRDLGVHPPAKATIRPRDHALTTDRICVSEDSIGNEFCMLDDVSSVADDSENEDLSFR